MPNTNTMTPEQHARIKKCVDKLMAAGTDMEKDTMFGICTLQEKSGKLDESGHVIGAKNMAEEVDLSFTFAESEFVELPGEVEIFRSGNWKDGHGTPFDAKPEYVEQIFQNTKSLGFVQPLKLNHSDQTQFLESMKTQTGISLPTGGLPAIGYNPVTRTQKNPDGSVSVFGKLTNIPKHLSEVIKNLYRNRSAEIITVQDGKGGKKEVFSGVSFLGMTRPIITQLAASFGKMFKGEKPSMVYSAVEGDIRSFDFSDESIAAAKAVGLEYSEQAASKEDGSKTNIQKTKEAKVEFCKLTMPDGSVKTFATEEEFKGYQKSQIDAALEGMVPKSDLDRVKAEQEASKDAVYFSEIENEVNKLLVQNEQKKAFPPVLKEKLLPALKSIPRTLQFGERGREQSPAKAIIALFAEIGRIGLVDFSENVTNKDPKEVQKSEREKEFRKEYQENKVAFGEQITEDEYVRVNLQGGK